MKRKILQRVLTLLAAKILSKYKPRIVAVSGSVGKTSTKEAIASVLTKHFRIRKTEQNFNTEIGVPLTIIGVEPKHAPKFSDYITALWRGVFLLASKKSDYPEVLILELAADRPGNIRWFAKWLKPDVTVITAIGEIPVHVEYYSSPQEVAAEKSWLVHATSPYGTVILNRDDLAVWEMHSRTKARILSFGFVPESDFRIAEYSLLTEESASSGVPEGIGFKLFRRGTFVPFRLKNTYGKPQSYAAAAAAAVAETFDINLVETADALLDYQPPAGRMHIIKGIKNTWILDDTYNASPASMHAALETLDGIPSKRKIAALGDMREIGKFTFEAHQAIGYLAGEICDILVTVGDTAKIIGEGAKEKGFPAEKIFSFETSKEAGEKLRELLRTGDLVLVKGSRAVHMENAIKSIMSEPERAGELLVHQI